MEEEEGEWGKVKIRKEKNKGGNKGWKEKEKEEEKEKEKKSDIYHVQLTGLYLFFFIIIIIIFFSSTFWQIQLNHRFSLLVCVCFNIGLLLRLIV